MTPKTSGCALEALAVRVETLTKSSNAIDVLCEIALFDSDRALRSIRANDAGTKVIYTTHDGTDATSWAYDWTFDAPTRANTAQLLRARQATSAAIGVDHQPRDPSSYEKEPS